MTTTGVTLSGSYSEASATPSAYGFQYGTATSGSLNLSVSATANGSNFSASLANLEPGTEYIYRAFVTVSGTGDYSGQSQTFYSTERSFTTTQLPVATATVTTGTATPTVSSATLNGSYSGASGTVSERGFVYKKNDGVSVYSELLPASGSGTPFSLTVSDLDAGTTYLFKAYVKELNQRTGQVETRYGSEVSFTTTSQSAQVESGWLELPEVTGNEDFVGRFYGTGSTAGTNRNYSYSYNYTYYASMWVAYPLTAAHTSGSASTSSWRYNPNITPNSKQVNIVSNSYGTMYGDDSYARGHQCPNASRKSDDTMNLQTYYSTNQTPQLQNKFNGSIWGSLEGAVRNLTNSVDTVYVVTGPLYRKVGDTSTPINYLTGASSSANPSSLPIPNYYWKALLKVKRSGSGQISEASTIGFWFDHREYQSSEHYYDSEHIVSVNQIETWTGLNLFCNLPDSIEETAESNTSWTNFQSYSNVSSAKDNNWGTFRWRP